MNQDVTHTGAELRRQAQREEVRGEILAAARNLVDRQGPNALTMRAVASAVGYSPGALYEYFGSKQKMLEALYFHGAEGLEGRTRQVMQAAGPHASAADRVGMAGRAYRSFALDHPDLYLLIFSVRHPAADAALPHAYDPDADASFGSLVGMLREAIERGEVAGGEPQQLAASLWAFVHGFVMLEITGRLPQQSPAASDGLFETGLTLLREGLKPRSNSTSQESIS